MKIKVFNPNQLKGLIEEATIDQNEQEWHQAFLTGVSGLIKKDPIKYRSFGPFWWVLKRYLQTDGFIEGEPVDPELFDQVTMGDKTLDLAAAFAYQDWTSASFTANANVRDVETDEGETIEYPVIDEEYEAMALVSL